MEQIISLPLWMLAAAVGLPSVCLLMVVFRLWRRKIKRNAGLKRQTTSVQLVPAGDYAERIQQQVLCQHIDAVFTALMAVIESERTKLKALAGSVSANRIMAEKTSDTNQPACRTKADPELKVEEPHFLGQSIAEMAAQGIEPGDIARRMGISKNEVSLALKMSSRRQESGGRLEAVA